MKLLLRRSQRSSAMGKVIFTLDARADLSKDEQKLVKKYGLGKTVVYDSNAREKYATAAFEHVNAPSGSILSIADTGKSLYQTVKGLGNLAMMAFTLRVTVDSLVSGQHIECKELDELLSAEAVILAACKNLKTYLETAVTFDGREEVIEF